MHGCVRTRRRGNDADMDASAWPPAPHRALTPTWCGARLPRRRWAFGSMQPTMRHRTPRSLVSSAGWCNSLRRSGRSASGCCSPSTTCSRHPERGGAAVRGLSRVAGRDVVLGHVWCGNGRIGGQRLCPVRPGSPARCRACRGVLLRIPLTDGEDVDRAVDWFARPGDAAVFTGRFVPWSAAWCRCRPAPRAWARCGSAC